MFSQSWVNVRHEKGPWRRTFQGGRSAVKQQNRRFQPLKKVLFVQRRFSAQIVHILRRCSQWKGFLTVQKSHRCKPAKKSSPN